MTAAEPVELWQFGHVLPLVKLMSPVIGASWDVLINLSSLLGVVPNPMVPTYSWNIVKQIAPLNLSSVNGSEVASP